MTMRGPMPRTDPSHVPPDQRALPRDVKIAVDYMRANIDLPIRVADLVAATRTPERTLRKHFHQFMRLSPLRFLKLLRLARARDTLLGVSDHTVTETATRCGFTHLGRFSSDYRRGIGELPSATRRRASPAGNADGSPRRETPAPFLSLERPVVVIGQFQTRGDRESNHFAAELRELIAAELGRGRAFAVKLAPAAGTVPISWSGVRYQLLGRVIRVEEHTRVVVRLVDADAQCHLWGDSFDSSAADELALQDRIVARLLHEIAPHILGARIDQARLSDPGVLTAHQIALRALPLVISPSKAGQGPSGSRQAAELLDHAMRVSPDCALAVALAGWRKATTAILAWNLRSREDGNEAKRLADQAGILAADDPMVLAIRASIAHLTGEFDAAVTLAARSVAIDPTNALGLDRLGWVHEALSRPDDAIPYFTRVERLHVPYLDGAAALDGVGTAHFCAGRYEEACVLLKSATLIRPGSAGLHGKLAACYARLRETAAARTQVEMLRRILPDVSVEQYVGSYPCRYESFTGVLANCLVKIGMRP